MKKGLIVALVFMLMSLVGIAFAAPTLPDNVQVIAPDQNVDPYLAEFSGIWKGSWLKDYCPGMNVKTETNLVVVNRIENDLVSLFFYSGEVAGWTHYIGKYNPETKQVVVLMNHIISDTPGNAFFWVKSDGTLHGYKETRAMSTQRKNMAIFAKQE